MQTDRKVPVNSKTWLITGASSGLGFALAQYVLEQGDCAVLGARNLHPMSELVAHFIASYCPVVFVNFPGDKWNLRFESALSVNAVIAAMA